MNRYLITGVSSGIGRALTKKLIKEGNFVWGIARRKKLLEDLKKELNNNKLFVYSEIDISKKNSWTKLISEMKIKKYIPEVIIFNAAINQNDITSGIEIDLTREIFDINLFSALEGINSLLSIIKLKSQFIAISSSSSFKGSGIEGIGYPASKAALSIAFESLHQKFKNKYLFKTIYFGPVNSGMVPFKKNFPLLLTEEKAISKILEVVKENKAIYYCPEIIFFVIKIIKLFPSNIYFWFLDNIEKNHVRNQK